MSPFLPGPRSSTDYYCLLEQFVRAYERQLLITHKNEHDQGHYRPAWFEARSEVNAVFFVCWDLSGCNLWRRMCCRRILRFAIAQFWCLKGDNNLLTDGGLGGADDNASPSSAWWPKMSLCGPPGTVRTRREGLKPDEPVCSLESMTKSASKRAGTLGRTHRRLRHPRNPLRH